MYLRQICITLCYVKVRWDVTGVDFVAFLAKQNPRKEGRCVRGGISVFSLQRSIALQKRIIVLKKRGCVAAFAFHSQKRRTAQYENPQQTKEK